MGTLYMYYIHGLITMTV